MIALPNKADPGGRVSFVQWGRNVVPFDFKRVFWITDMYPSSIRGNHAHKKCEQFVVAISGGCKAKGLTPDNKEFFFRIPGPTVGLYVPPMHWLNLYDFQPRTAIMVLASHEYEESDYIRSIDDFPNAG